MRTNLAYLPSSRGEFVELARTAKGRVFRKEILHMNDSFVHPNNPSKKIRVDEKFAETLVRNFDNGVCDIVQVPIVDGHNQHVEDPVRNIGEVIGLEYDDKGVYALIDARKDEYAKELGKTLLGASAMLHLNYADTRTGDAVGPALLHVAITNRPYITNLDEFEEIVAASADTKGERPVVLSPANDEKESGMDLDELLAALKDEHGIDVNALQEQAQAANPQELITALSNVLQSAGAVVPSAQEEAVTIEDVAEAVIELSQEKVALAETVAHLKEESDALKLSAAEAEIDAHVKNGRILPAQRDAMLELRLSAPEMYERLLPTDAIVSLSEEGVTTHDEPHNETFESDIARLAEVANARTGRRK